MILLFLQVRYNKEMSLAQKLRRVDYLGNIILIASTVSILWSLTYAGTRYPWSSWRILFPLFLGLAGLLFFVYFETTRFVKDPVVPLRLFTNRTSATVFAITFLNSALLYWMMFFLPVYFQVVLLSSPARTGVQLLPAIFIAIPAAITAVLLLSKFGKYKPLHFIGFAANTLGLGMFTLLDRDSSTAEWVIYQMITAGGSGFVLNTLLPACQTPLDEVDQAAATATWSFIRSFGNIWGVAIPAAVFNNFIDENVWQRVTDETVAASLVGGNAYGLGTAGFVNGLVSETTRDQVVGLYTDGLKRVWQISIVFAGVAFLLVFLERQMEMRTELETEFGMEGKDERKGPQV